MSAFYDDDAHRRGALAAAGAVLAAVGDAVERHSSLLDLAAADTDRLTATTLLAMGGPPSEADLKRFRADLRAAAGMTDPVARAALTLLAHTRFQGRTRGWLRATGYDGPPRPREVVVQAAEVAGYLNDLVARLERAAAPPPPPPPPLRILPPSPPPLSLH